MFGKILAKSKKNSKEANSNKELKQKISKMNLTDMRLYVNDNLKDFPLSEEGLVEIMRRLTQKDSSTSKRYIEIGDMDSKIKKAFDLVISVASSKKVSVKATELIQEFSNIYANLILKYDTQYKEIYSSRLKDSLQKAIITVEQISQIEERMDFLNG